jgi:hypothetical protein
MVLTAYFVLSPVTGLFCHRRWRIEALSARSGSQNLRQLDASVGASGPHDFAVRDKAPLVGALSTAHGKTRPAISPRARHRRVHRIPPRVRDDRDTPLCGTGRHGYITDLGGMGSVISEIPKIFGA